MRKDVGPDPRFDWTVAGLSVIFIGGVVIDIWAHNHDRVDTTFFTPWHAGLYGGFGLLLAFLAITAVRNAGRGFWRPAALPPGYWLSLIGAFGFLAGGVLDMLWHMAFGFEVDVDALLSPTHLVLMTSGVLIVTGPLRAAWQAYAARSAPGWPRLGPALIGATLTYVVVMLFTQFAHPYVNRWAAVSHRPPPVASEIYVMKADGTDQRRLIVDPSHRYEGYTLSPDGSRAAVAVGLLDDDGRTEINVGPAALDKLRVVSHAGGHAQVPVWSPDGTRIAYLVTRHDTQRIEVVDVANGATIVVAADNGGKSNASWSPDGTRIVFASDASGEWQLYVVSAGGGKPAALNTRGYAVSPAWSPRGDRIAFAGQSGIAIIPADGRRAPVYLSRGADAQPAWSGDGSTIAFVRNNGLRRDIYVVPSAGGKIENVSKNPGMDNSQPRFSPAGRTIAWTATGRPGGASEYVRQASGIAEVLLQGVVLAAMLVVLLRWQLPLGAAFVLVVVGNAAIAVQQDYYELLVGALLTAVVAEALIAWWQPLDGAKLVATCALVPAMFTAAYLASLAIFGPGIGWSAHLTAGAPVFAGLGGAALALVARR